MVDATEGDRQIARAIIQLYAAPGAIIDLDRAPGIAELEGLKRIARRDYEKLPPEIRVLMHLKGWLP